MTSSQQPANYVENLRTLTQGLKPTGLHWTSEDEDTLGKPPVHPTKDDLTTTKRRNSKTTSSHETNSSSSSSHETSSSSSCRKPPPPSQAADVSRLLEEREEMCRKRHAAQIDELQREHTKMLKNLRKETERLQILVFDLNYRLTLKNYPIEELKGIDSANHTPAIHSLDDVIRNDNDDIVHYDNYDIVDAQNEELAKVREICMGKDAKIADLEQKIADLRLMCENQKSELTLLLSNQNKQKSFDRSAPPVNVTGTAESTAKGVKSAKAPTVSHAPPKATTVSQAPPKAPTVSQAPTISHAPMAAAVNHPSAPAAKATVGHSRSKVTIGQSAPILPPPRKGSRDRTAAGQSNKVPVIHQKSTGGAASSSASIGKMTRTASVAAASTTTNQNHSAPTRQPIGKRDAISTSKSMEMKENVGGGAKSASNKPSTNQKSQQQQQQTKSWK